jgi:hypothetical protein
MKQGEDTAIRATDFMRASNPEHLLVIAAAPSVVTPTQFIQS